MGSPPTWFITIVYAELLLQLPFFPFAAWAFITGKDYVVVVVVVVVVVTHHHP